MRFMRAAVDCSGLLPPTKLARALDGTPVGTACDRSSGLITGSGTAAPGVVRTRVARRAVRERLGTDRRYGDRPLHDVNARSDRARDLR